MFNETTLSRMQNIITMKMVEKSANNNSFKYLGQDVSERNRTVDTVVRDVTGDALLVHWYNVSSKPFYSRGTWPTERSWLLGSRFWGV